jgi:hypothetical protein
MPLRGIRAALGVLFLISGARAALSKCPLGQLEYNGECLPILMEPGTNPAPPGKSSVSAPPLGSAMDGPPGVGAIVVGILPAITSEYVVRRMGDTIVTARLLMRSADIPPRGVGGYGIVALTALPTSESRDRLTRVCEAYTHALPRQRSLPRTIRLRDQMLTVWPIDDPDAPPARADDCAYLTSHYDLFGGQAAIRDAARQGLSLSGRGPYLIAWSPSENRGVPDKIVLVYDLSGYSSQASFDAVFSIWQNAIIANPALWRNGVAPSQKRLIFRDFVDDTSEAFLTALHISSK